MKQNTTVRSIRKDGKELRLANGSRWEIGNGDSTKTMIWQKSNRVVVEDYPNDEIYPYRIRNLDTSQKETVQARPGYL